MQGDQWYGTLNWCWWNEMSNLALEKGTCKTEHLAPLPRQSIVLVTTVIFVQVSVELMFENSTNLSDSLWKQCKNEYRLLCQNPHNADLIFVGGAAVMN